MKDGWEFPGGKVEPGEIPEEALKREILEELGIEIAVGEQLITVETDYLAFHLSMACYLANIVSGEPILKEYEAARWVDQKSLCLLAWLPADIEAVRALEKRISKVKT